MRTREGYLRIDHSASPGLSESHARAAGLDPKLCAEGKVLEAATLGCAHCQAIVIKHPERERARASCDKCGMKFICDVCDADRRMPDYVHLPFAKRADLVREFAAKNQEIPPALLRFKS